MKEHAIGVAQDFGKALPPVAAIVAEPLTGITLSDVLVALTIAYTFVILVHRLIHWKDPPKGK